MSFIVKLRDFFKKTKLKAIRNYRKLTAKPPKRKFFYAFYYKHKKIKPGTILIESFHGSNISDSSLVFAREIIKSYPGKYKIYYGTIDKKLHQKFVDDIGLDVELIDVNSIRYTKILATCEYLISNASFPVYFVKRDEQKYIQTWHGTPLKTLGKDMRLGIESMYNVQHNFLQADYITFPNDFTRDIMMDCYNLSPLYTGKVVMAGYPRNEIFFDTEQGIELKKKLGLEGKTIFGYMPTWRGKSNADVSTDAYKKTVFEIFSKLDEQLKDDQILFVNFHPILKNSISLDEYKHIKPFPAGVDNYSFLNCCDCLVTDYSSVFFDYSLTKKPIVLFMYDYEEYMGERGMYMDVAELPFTKVYDTDEFCRILREETFKGDSYENTEYFKTFFKYDAPDISGKLLKLLFNGEESDLEIKDYSSNKEIPYKVIYPQVIKGFNEFNTIAKLADDNTIAYLERRWFKKKVSPTLHDDFYDSFKYVIITKTTPRTYLEEFFIKLGVQSVKDKVWLREIKRTFPNLNINPEFITEYSVFEENCNVSPADIRRVLLTSVEQNGKDLKVTFDNNDYELQSVAIMAGNTIKFICELDSQFKDSNTFIIPVQQFIEEYKLYNGEKRKIGVIATEKSTGKKCMLVFAKTLETNGISLSDRYEKPLIEEYSLAADYFKTNLKKLFNSEKDRDKELLETFDLTVSSVKVAVIPYFANNALCVYISKEDAYLQSIYSKGSLTSISTCKNRCTLKVEFDRDDSIDFTGAVLKYRSAVDDISIPLSCKVFKTSNKVIVKIDIEFNDKMNLKPIYWDIYVTVQKFGTEQLVKIDSNKNAWNRIKLMSVNCVCDIGDNNIIFPYFGKGRILCFCIKEKDEYDTQFVKFKELFAYGLYLLFGSYWRKKKIWLVYEKFSKYAQDNGYFFFKYCMEQLSDDEKKNIYYVIDKRSPDYKNIEKFDSHVIQFMSIKHMIYCLAMKICIASDSKPHLYKWRSTPSIINIRLKKKQELFLQHGVTALKKVHHLFGVRGSSPMKYFVTTGKVEQDIAISELGYTELTAPITGFARWDALVDKKTPDDRMILVMPTWRSWLEDVSDEEFMQSDYYLRYTNLLKSEKLANILNEGNARVVFYIHPKFADYIENFKDLVSDNISYIPFGEEPLNELMMKCSMLITDYSSVCWDVYYLDKPVLFYQFDYEKYSIAHGSYINMETSLFGNRSTEEDALIRDIEYFIKHNFEESEKDRADASKYFEYRDNNNSKRIYQFLKNNRY